MHRQKRTSPNNKGNYVPVFKTEKNQLSGGARRAPDNTRSISHYYKLVEPEAFHLLSSNEKQKEIPTMINRAGTVNFYNSEKGYGFIRDNISLATYFVYRSCLQRPVSTKDTVVFDIEMAPGGPIAINVRKIEHSIT